MLSLIIRETTPDIAQKDFFLPDISGVVKVGRYNIFHRSLFIVTIMRWQKTSGLANQSSPTLTTPKCIKYQKISYIYLFCIRTRRFESHGATDLRQGINRSISARFAGREGNAKHMDATTRPTISTWYPKEKERVWGAVHHFQHLAGV